VVVAPGATVPDGRTVIQPRLHPDKGPAASGTCGADTFIPVTNAIESLNARYQRAVRARGHFPTEPAALKCLYLVTRSSTPPDEAGHDGSHAGRSALNAFAITFEGRLTPSTTN
jgi:hypothetical protein